MVVLDLSRSLASNSFRGLLTARGASWFASSVDELVAKPVTERTRPRIAMRLRFMMSCVDTDGLLGI